MAVCRRWILFGILMAVLGFAGSWSVGAEVHASEFEESGIRYLIYLDDLEFEVTREQYIALSELQGNQEGMRAYLKYILGDRMPENFTTISGHVVTGAGAGSQDPTATKPPVVATSSESGQDQRKDFVIQGGRLVSYRGTSSVVKIPSDVTMIESMAFYGNTYVKSIEVPASVKSIGTGAFYRCSALKYIRFRGGNISLGKAIVSNCDKLTNLVAPKGSKIYKYAENNDIPVVTSSNVQLDRKKIYLVQGDSDKLRVYNNIYKVNWRSSKSGVVSVTSGGKLKAGKSGNANITAMVDGTKYVCRVQVYKKGVQTRINQIIRSEIRSGMSNYEKVKAVHNWMIKNVKYDYYRLLRGIVYIPKVSHTAKGALVKKLAVCDGYAYAYQMIMKKLKIPCKFVTGRSSGIGHAWNMVKLGGKWYHIDVTFDDPIVNGSNANTTPYYTYFLKSSATMRKTHHFNAKKFPNCSSKKYE